MKQIVKKRLIYTCPWTKEVFYGVDEYDSNLSDSNILGAIHEVGKTVWLPTYPGEEQLWLLRPHPINPNVKLPTYRIEVDTFYVDCPSFLDMILSFLR